MDVQAYLESLMKVTKDPTLEAMEFLLQKLGNPHKKTRFIHIAGTNGKGSVCEMMNQILIEAGYRTGKFISPGLLTLNERIMVNNIPIPDSDIEKILVKMDPFIKEYNNTHKIEVKWFEVITTIALVYYERQKCDFVVLETGLGGTYDCTNVVDSEISIISSIGLDHMHILGNTIAEIAENKAGIIKKNSDAIFLNYPENSEALPVIEKRAKEMNAKLHLVQEDDVKNYSFDENYQYYTYKNYENVAVNLKGKIQTYNATVCLKAVEILNQKGDKIEESAIKRALKEVIHRARFEKLNSNPEIIYDGAHNPQAIENLIKNINQYYSNNKKVFVISILTTKDHKSMVNLLAREYQDAEFYFTSGSNDPKYVNAKDLEGDIDVDIDSHIENLETILGTIMKDYKDAKDTVVFVVGSFYVYGTVLNSIDKNK